MNGTADFAALRARLQPQCDAIIGQYEEKRSALLMLMHLFQEVQGYVSHDAIEAVSEMLSITPAETEGTVSFYTLLYRKPVGKYMLQPCRGLACAINGADDIMAYFRERLGSRSFGNDRGRFVLVRRSRVFGGLRPSVVHASQSRVRVRSDAG